MINCPYCGRENEDVRSNCWECGTWMLPPLPPLHPVPPPLPGLNAGKVSLILLAYLGAQFFAALVVGLIIGLARIVHAAFTQGHLHASHDSSLILGCSLPAAAVATGLVMYFLPRAMFGDKLADTSPEGAAWKIGSRKNLLFGFGLGALLAVGYLVFAGSLIQLLGPNLQTGLGPLNRLAQTPGWSQAALAFFAIVCAPVLEELLFRGLLYGGFRRSFGPIKAAVLVTFIFDLLHITEVMYYWPGLIGITGLAMLALWLRLRTASLGPGIAAHFAYNLILISLAIGSSLAK